VIEAHISSRISYGGIAMNNSSLEILDLPVNNGVFPGPKKVCARVIQFYVPRIGGIHRHGHEGAGNLSLSGNSYPHQEKGAYSVSHFFGSACWFIHNEASLI